MVSTEKKEYENHLINEKSPYLLQHAHNPVDWYPWGDEAFEKAEKENKPIFLSIGYSTCHWCHVMAHESFEDPEIGEMINRVFVPVKVDREERPDIDSTYMHVCQMMTGSGGWPLTLILTPEGKPFFAGTYFPKESRYGSIGLKDLILKVEILWRNNPQEAQQSAEQIVNVLEKTAQVEKKEDIPEDIFERTFQGLKDTFDEINGGFGKLQKFPTPHNLYFLLRYWKRSLDMGAWNMVKKTLDKMQQGGIYDHVGFGFHRYAIDPEWIVPHFEKMLYDQGLISLAYLEAFQVSGDKSYEKRVREIFEYVLRDLRSSEGGFYSAEDADSEGVEGKFYLWSKKEIEDVLEDDAPLMMEIYNIKEAGNFLDESTGEKTGKNILYQDKPLEDICEDKGLSLNQLEDKIDKWRGKLFKVREKRIHPHKDDKILTDWNGLMIAALAKGAQVLNEKKYLQAAESAADFILKEMCADKRLMHRYRDGESAVTGYLDDYAFFIWGLLELYQANFKDKYLAAAYKLNQSLLKYFFDIEEGGFYFTPEDGEKILIRKKESFDSAIPSGNSIQTLNLLKISLLIENLELKEYAIKNIDHFSPKIKKSQLAHTQFINALDFEWGPYWNLVISCPEDEPKSREIPLILGKYFLPKLTLILKDKDSELEWLLQINESLKAKKPVDNKCTAYLCSDEDCKNPSTQIEDILTYLDPKTISNS